MSFLEEGPIRKLLREKGVLKRTPEAKGGKTEFYTIMYVIEAKDFPSAEEIMVKGLKFFRTQGIDPYETDTRKGWATRK